MCSCCKRVFKNDKALYVHAALAHQNRLAVTKAKTLHQKWKELIAKSSRSKFIKSGAVQRVEERTTLWQNFFKKGQRIYSTAAADLLITGCVDELVEEMGKTILEGDQEWGPVQSRANNSSIHANWKNRNWIHNIKHCSSDCKTCVKLDPDGKFRSDSKPWKNSGKRKMKFELVVTADGKELVGLCGVTSDHCPFCHVGTFHHTKTRGNEYSCLPLPSYYLYRNIYARERNLRNTDTDTTSAATFKEKLQEAITTDETILTNKRQNKSGETKLSNTCSVIRKKTDDVYLSPIFQADRDMHKVGELHTVLNIVLRFYECFEQLARIMDLEMIMQDIETVETADAWKHFTQREAQLAPLAQKIEAQKKENEKNTGAKADEKGGKDKLAKLEDGLKNLTAQVDENWKSLCQSRGIFQKLLYDAFAKMGCLLRREKGGYLIGDQCYTLLQYPEITNLFRRRTVVLTSRREIKVGSDDVADLLFQYMNIRKEEFELTCRPKNLCVHEIVRLEKLMGSAMRLESNIFPNSPIQMSSHFRTHILADLKKGRGILWSDRYTERAHQIIIKVNEQLKRMRPGSLYLANRLQWTDLYRTGNRDEIAPPRIAYERKEPVESKKAETMKTLKSEVQEGVKTEIEYAATPPHRRKKLILAKVTLAYLRTPPDQKKKIKKKKRNKKKKRFKCRFF